MTAQVRRRRGLLVGTVLCFTNMYFGLQAAVTVGSIQCALVGFLLVRPLACGRARRRSGRARTC